MKTFWAVIFFVFAIPVHAAQTIKVGVLAPQGAEHALERWGVLFDRLERELAVDVTLVPSSAREGIAAFIEGDIDFLLGNPVQSAIAVDLVGATPVASVVRASGAKFAGLIVVKGSSNITGLEDLRGTRMATLGDWAAGGYIFQADYIVSAGFPIPSEFGERVPGENQNELVQMVMSDAADAAFIRTGVLEDLIERGVIQKGDLRVIDDKSVSEGGPSRTTDWFPEWSFSAHPDTEAGLVSRMQERLIAIEAGAYSLSTARIVKFQEPLDNSEVVRAMKQLRIVPFDAD